MFHRTSIKKKMIIAIRNFKRNKMVNLTARSIKHFMPDLPIYCFTFYKELTDYNNQEPLLPFITEIKNKTKYVSNKNIHDHIDSRKTSGFANPDNGMYFCEGFNTIFNTFKNRSDKVVMLAEDHFTTKGIYLKELYENDWNVAFASAFNKDANANASILGIVPTKVAHLFPLPEINKMCVEEILTKYLVKKVKNKSRVYQLKCRNWIDYCGDGEYTNSSLIIETRLKEAGII